MQVVPRAEERTAPPARSRDLAPGLAKGSGLRTGDQALPGSRSRWLSRELADSGRSAGELTNTRESFVPGASRGTSPSCYCVPAPHLNYLGNKRCGALLLET